MRRARTPYGAAAAALAVRCVWPLRTALACAAASLVHLSSRADDADALLPGRLFAAICAVVVCSASWGGTLRAAAHVCAGAAGGGALAAAALAACGTSPPAVYGILVCGSLLILLPALPTPSAKLAWAVLVGGLTTADADARAGVPFDALFPLKLALVSVAGAAAAVLASAPPWPRSRAAGECAAATRRAAHATASAAAALARALAADEHEGASGGERRGALCARAEALLSAASAAREAAGALVAEAAWEPGGRGRRTVAEAPRALARLDGALERTRSLMAAAAAGGARGARRAAARASPRAKCAHHACPLALAQALPGSVMTLHAHAYVLTFLRCRVRPRSADAVRHRHGARGARRA
jgi:hypothetical protein